MTTEESLVSFGLKQASFKSLKKKQLNFDIPSITITYVKKEGIVYLLKTKRYLLKQKAQVEERGIIFAV